jgi:hypothetical protein
VLCRPSWDAFALLKRRHAYDDAVREAGRRVVNFPRPGTDEVRAVKGEREEATMLRAAGKLRSGPPPPAPDYKGVTVNTHTRTSAVFTANFSEGGRPKILCHFCTAEDAARAYDHAMRKAGRRLVNFPRPGTNEVQAVKGEKEEVTLLRAASKLLPSRIGPLPPPPDYKGVSVDASVRHAAVFLAYFRDGGGPKILGRFCTAEEAARARRCCVKGWPPRR